MTYGIIGVGAIASAIVTGLCREGDAPSIVLSPRNARVAAGLAARFPTVSVAPDNQSVIDAATVAILAVRPQDAPEVLSTLRFRADQTVLSVIAAMSVATLASLVAPATDIVRSIPLPTVADRQGTTPIHPPHDGARSLFDRLGCTIEVADEAAFDALSAASSTVAAHFAYLQAVSGWLADHGLPEDQARRYVASIFAGLSEALKGDTPDFAALAGDHATPGGLNEQFRAFLQDAGLFDHVDAGLDRILERVSGGSKA
ncbi:pyrroline-5-carboxylate reductase [Consotaella aegiceratis]|uniref:pyrroline-5-carboxylate reductase n=1 Tax=Consotaella aegiceratis TaxID=3097961 RepID=UPI002F409819